MTKFRPVFLGFLTFLLLVVLAPHVRAEPLVSPVKPHEKTVLLLPIQQLGQQLQSLVSNAAASKDATDEDSNAEPAPTFGTKALNLVINAADLLRSQAQIYITNFADLPQLATWFNLQRNDPRLRERWNMLDIDLLNVVGISFLGALAFELVLLPARRTLRRRKPGSFRARVATVFALFVLRALPIMVFVGASLMLLDQNDVQHLPRFVVLNVVYAIALSRIIFALIRGLLAPSVTALRFIPITTEQALYAYRWLGAFSLVIIYGYFLVDLARAVRVPDGAITAFGNILGLVLVIMTMVVIVQRRALAATLLRGQLSAAQPNLSLIDGLRLWLARHWHMLAISYLVIGYGIAALGVQNGFVVMLRGTIATLLIFAAVRVLFHATSRWGATDTTAGAAIHHMILRLMMRFIIWALAVIGIAAGWGADIAAFFATSLGQHVLGSIFSIGITVITVTLIYETFNASIERRLNRCDDEGKPLPASARMRTLLPMIRNAVFIGFTIIVSLVVLSEAGVNIGPLLAGAGVLGVAVGFGSQTLVKDFITGLFIVIENTIAVGDVVKIGTHSGAVEGFSIRTLRIRDADGALHILPFSEVTQIINMTKDFAYAVINVGVSYDTDLEKAMAAIRAVGEEMQKDPVFKRVILEPVEVLGVDALGDSSITLLARLRVRPGKQWDVKRMFLLRLKQRFDKEGIEIPFPTVTSIQKTPKV